MAQTANVGGTWRLERADKRSKPCPGCKGMAKKGPTQKVVHLKNRRGEEHPQTSAAVKQLISVSLLEGKMTALGGFQKLILHRSAFPPSRRPKAQAFGREVNSPVLFESQKNKKKSSSKEVRLRSFLGGGALKDGFVLFYEAVFQKKGNL